VNWPLWRWWRALVAKTESGSRTAVRVDCTIALRLDRRGVLARNVVYIRQDCEQKGSVVVLIKVIPLLFRPQNGWASVKRSNASTTAVFFGHTALLALIPPVCGFIGTTQTGWSLGLDRPVRLTAESALSISIAYYVALLVATMSVAWAAHWMARTYGAQSSFSAALTLASLTATPLFLVGFGLLLPELWVNLVLGLPALAWTIALFYTGVSIMLDIPEERAFLFASAVMAFGLVALVAMLVTSVLLWSYGFAPVFSS
jgi:hypothetical protein